MTREAEHKRLVLLRKYYRQAIVLGVPEELCHQAFLVWERGVKSLKDQLVLRDFDKALGGGECA